MKHVGLPVLALLLVGAVALAAQGQDRAAAAQDKAPAMKTSAVPDTPAWRQLKSLVGSWEGTMQEGTGKNGCHGGRPNDRRRLGIMHMLGRDTPYEMVTMIHPTGSGCWRRTTAPRTISRAWRSLRRRRRTRWPSTSSTGRNIAPGEVHMRSVVFTFVDADHHEERWTSSDGGAPAVFTFTRKK